MSDKNRNMNDINDKKTAEQQAFSEEIRRRLAEPGSGKPTLDEFKVMVYKDREKRRKKRNALVACIVAAFIVGYLTYDDLVPEVGADKNPKETIVTEDGVIIEDGGYGSSVGEENVWVTEDWEQVEDAKMLVPEILIPQYMPNEYKFKKLTVEHILKEVTRIEYLYSSDDNNALEIELVISNKGEERIEIEGVIEELDSKEGKIYVGKAKNNKIATIYTDDGIIINIWYELSNAELIKVIEGLDN